MEKSTQTKEYKKFVQKLRKARVEAGLTQVDVSTMLNKSQSFVSKVEAGEQRVDVVELKQFAKLYKKPMDFFINF